MLLHRCEYQTSIGTNNRLLGFDLSLIGCGVVLFEEISVVSEGQLLIWIDFLIWFNVFEHNSFGPRCNLLEDRSIFFFFSIFCYLRKRS